MKNLIVNAKVVTPYRVLPFGTSVVTADSKIIGVTQDAVDPASFDGKVVDANGLFLAPGFIDTHTHGAGNCDFMDGDMESVLHACRTHMQYGTTSIVPTTLSSRDDKLLQNLDNIAKAKSTTENMPNILGSHLEGPYFAPAQNGAQDEKYLKTPKREEYERIIRLFPSILKWTVAPELPGALEMGRFLREKGVIASMGHSDGTEEDVANAIENGYTMVTHLYNAMSRLTRKNARMFLGIAESTLLHDELTAEVIADGCHLPIPLLKLILKAKGPERICLVTDSMRAAGVDATESILGSLKNGQKVEIEGGVAYMPGRRSFGGSICTADRLVRTMYHLVDVPITTAVQMLTDTPARTLGVSSHKGSIGVGMDADMILFNENIDIKMVMVMGRIWKDRITESQP